MVYLYKTYHSSVLRSPETLAYDPWLHSIKEIQKYEKNLEAKSHELCLTPIFPHLIDELWKDRPSPPAAADSPLQVHPLIYAWQNSAEKRKNLAAAIDPALMTVLTRGDSIAWLLNIRGQDIPFTPIPQAYAICHTSAKENRSPRVDVFIDLQKVTPKITQHVGEDLSFFPLSTSREQLSRQSAGKKISIDLSHTPAAICSLLP